MRTIDRTNQFKRDYKRELKGRHRATLNEDFIAVVKLLVNDLCNELALLIASADFNAGAILLYQCSLDFCVMFQQDVEHNRF